LTPWLTHICTDIYTIISASWAENYQLWAYLDQR